MNNLATEQLAAEFGFTCGLLVATFLFIIGLAIWFFATRKKNSEQLL